MGSLNMKNDTRIMYFAVLVVGIILSAAGTASAQTSLPTSLPEPSTSILLGIGLTVLAYKVPPSGLQNWKPRKKMRWLGKKR